jgi:hypothetical protein
VRYSAMTPRTGPLQLLGAPAPQLRLGLLRLTPAQSPDTIPQQLAQGFCKAASLGIWKQNREEFKQEVFWVST